MAAPSQKGRVAVFARARPTLEREQGDHEVVLMDPAARRVNVRVEEGDSLERALTGAPAVRGHAGGGHQTGVGRALAGRGAGRGRRLTTSPQRAHPPLSPLSLLPFFWPKQMLPRRVVQIQRARVRL